MNSKTCAYRLCENEFSAENPAQIYCSNSCKNKENRARKKRGETNPRWMHAPHKKRLSDETKWQGQYNQLLKGWTYTPPQTVPTQHQRYLSRLLDSTPDSLPESSP